MNDRTLCESREVAGFTIEIYYDECPQSPREWDNAGTIACKHRRYDLGDEQIGDPIDWLCDKLGVTPEGVARRHGLDAYSDETLALLEDRFFDEYIGYRLWLYEHSGVTISTKPFGCPWDSGKVGYIYISREDAAREWGKVRCTKDVVDKALKCLQSEIDTYDSYVRGEVYGYSVKMGDVEIDSCWGFYGSDFKTNGILEYVTAVIPNAKVVREYGDMLKCRWDGDLIRKIYAYELHGDVTKPYRSIFEIVEDTVTGEVEFKLLCDETV